jgi:hypothetical protein
VAEYHVVRSGDRWHVQRRGSGTLIGHKAGSVVSTHDSEAGAIDWARNDAEGDDSILVHRDDAVEVVVDDSGH